MPMGVAIGLLFAGIVIGFLLGTRARQLAASVKMIGRAALSLAAFKMPDKGDDAGDDESEMEKLDELKPVEGIEDFLSLSSNTGLEDHPETEFNPVLMYQIKLARDALREQKRREALEKAGEEQDDGLAAEASDKPCALSVLINVGARVLPVMASDGAANAAAQERRRLQRTVDVYLNRELSVETRGPAEKRRGKKAKTALEKANDTKEQPIGGTQALRYIRNLAIAKEGRNVLREWKKAHPELNQPLDDEDEDGGNMEEFRERMGGGGAQLDAGMLAMLQAEFDDDDVDWGGGMEGIIEPDAQLDA